MPLNKAAAFATEISDERTSTSAQPKTFEDALEWSIKDGFDKQIAIIDGTYSNTIEKGKNAGKTTKITGIPKGKSYPFCWLYTSNAGNTYYSWRIQGSPVFFFTDTEEDRKRCEKNKGMMRTNNPKEDLTALRDMIKAGEYREQLKEAFDRAAQKRADAAAKRRADKLAAEMQRS